MGVLAGASYATAGISGSVFFGGDPSKIDALASERNSSVGGTSTTYDDFRLNAPTIVNRVYGVFYSDMERPVGFDVEFRSNMSNGNGGALIAEFRNATGTWERLAQYDAFGVQAYRAVVDISGVNLDAAGVYYMGIRVVGNGTGRAWIAGTRGSGAMGGPINNGNSFFNSDRFGANWESAGRNATDDDFAYGVVPEPASMLALAGALGALAARRRRK